MTNFALPRIRYVERVDLEDIAEKQVHNSNLKYGHKFPFDIESYLWKVFRYRVQPTVNAEMSCNVDTALIVCKKIIRIDQKVYENQYRRACMSMAHELGHLILHDEYLKYVEKQLKIAKKTDEFQRIILSLPDKDSRRAEFQAHYLAGAIMAPRYKLEAELRNYIDSELKLPHGTCLTEEQREKVYNYLAEYFGLGKESIIRRIDVSHLAYLVDYYMSIQ